MNSSPQTRLAILGTMSELHRQPISYDLDCLKKVVVDVSPDLLCAEITIDAWEHDDLTGTSLEVRDALTPVIASTDIVLIPISPSLEQYADFMPDSGWRQRLVRTFDRILRWGQIQADNVQAINGMWFETFCHTVCWINEALWTTKDRVEWEKQNEEMVANIVHAVQRDGGRRVLVVVQCQRVHQLVPLLRAHDDLLKLVDYQEL